MGFADSGLLKWPLAVNIPHLLHEYKFICSEGSVCWSASLLVSPGVGLPLVWCDSMAGRTRLYQRGIHILGSITPFGKEILNPTNTSWGTMEAKRQQRWHQQYCAAVDKVCWPTVFDTTHFDFGI